MSTTLARTETESPKRRQILDAGAELFMLQGYGSVSMDAIARRAAVSKATLYAHFTSKDQLFATIVAEACQRNTADDRFLHPAGDDMRAALSTIARAGLRFLLQEQTLAIYRVAIAEGIRFPELGRAFYDSGPRRFQAVLGGWLAEQAAAGRLNVPDPLLAAEQFMALLRGRLFLQATLAVEPAPADAQIDASAAATVDTFLRAFGPG